MHLSRVAQILGSSYEVRCASEEVTSGNGNEGAPGLFFRVITGHTLSALRCLSYEESGEV